MKSFQSFLVSALLLVSFTAYSQSTVDSLEIPFSGNVVYEMFNDVLPVSSPDTSEISEQEWDIARVVVLSQIHKYQDKIAKLSRKVGRWDESLIGIDDFSNTATAEMWFDFESFPMNPNVKDWISLYYKDGEVGVTNFYIVVHIIGAGYVEVSYSSTGFSRGFELDIYEVMGSDFYDIYNRSDKEIGRIVRWGERKKKKLP